MKQKTHRLLSLLLTLALVLGMIPAIGTTAYAYSAGDIAGTTGSGTSEGDPVVCDTFAEFKAAMEDTQIRYVKLSGANEVIPSQESYDAAIKQYSDKTLIIDGYNTFTGALNGNHACLIYHAGGSLVVKGTGKLVFSNGMGASVGAVIWQQYSSLEIQSGVTLEGSANGATYGRALYIAGGTTVIHGGTFRGYTAMAGVYSSIDAVFVDAASDASLTIYGGTFSSNCHTSVTDTKTLGLSVNEGTVVLYGGTYYGIDADDANLHLSDMLGADHYYTKSDGTVFDGTAVTITTERLTVKTKRIDSLDVSITVPVAGANPQDPISNTENTKVTLTEWSSDGKRIENTDTFEPGKTYKVRVCVYTKGYYYFAETPTVTINGSTVITNFSRSGDALIFEVEFTTGKATINSVDVNITEPVAGAQPQNAVSNTANATVTTTVWRHNGVEMSASDTFVAGETYFVFVAVEPDSGYEFADNPTATFNGSTSGTISYKDEDNINYYAYFIAPATTTIDSVAMTVSAPEVGKTPNDMTYSATGLTAGGYWFYASANAYGVSMLGTTAFASDNTYSAIYRLRIPSGSTAKFASTISTADITINNGTVYAVNRVSDTVIEVTVNFGELKAAATEYAITVTDGKATVGADTEISKAAEGTTVTLTANKAPEGQVFNKWVVESGSITLADANSADTTFTMPAGAVSVKATYKAKPVTTYNLTTQVNGGHGTISAGKTGLTAGSTETVIFTPDTGYEIDTVTVNGVETGVLSNVLNVTMDADKTVIVTYKEITHTHTPSDWKSDADNHWKECTVVGCGVIIEGSKEAHTASDWITDTAATATTDGTKHKECTVCYRVLETGTIPATGSGSSGIIIFTYSTLTFDTNGGSSISKITKIKGTTVDLEKYEPTKEGYEFTGWYSDKELTDEITSIKLTNNTTVYAGWEAIKENPSTGAFPFVDVDTDDWFFEDVAYVYDKGLMNGVGDNLFAPEISTDRAMIVTILWRMEGCPVVNYAMNFTDVQEDQWYTEAIRWAEATGIVNGYGNGLFGTTDPITLEQAAAILYRYAAYKGWTDDTTVPILPAYTYSEWAENNVIWAELSGIFSGVGTELDDLTTAASRAEIASFLHRFCEDIAK